jgi:hypothetical protein
MLDQMVLRSSIESASETSNQPIAVARCNAMMPTHSHATQRGKRICSNRCIADFPANRLLDLAAKSRSLASRDSLP